MKTCQVSGCNNKVFTHGYCKNHAYKYYNSRVKKVKDRKVKKKKLPTFSKMKSDLDDVFSPYIRMRDCDERGYGKCFVCRRDGVAYEYIDADLTGLQNGHWLHRRLAPALVFFEWNCNAICPHCNKLEPVEYTMKMQAKYGEEKIAEFMDMKHNYVWKPSRPELENLIREYIRKFLAQCERIGHTPTIVEQRVINKYEAKEQE